MVVMKYCPSCGKKVGPEDRKCAYCGMEFTHGASNKTAGNETINPGKILNNRYKIISLLGKGGMGRVYKAYDMQLDDTVALKMLESKNADETMINRFMQEIKIARKITHENICRIYDLVEADGKKFISMQYIEGEDLKTILKREGALNPEKATGILRDILHALEVIHKNGIVHRDLKPSNIMVATNGKAYIADFGIAKALGMRDITQSGEMIGTPHYISPEQAQGGKIDHLSDIYSLGIVMFHMFTGQTPFKADSSVSLAVKHVQEQPPNPRDINSALPTDIAELILKCIRKNRFERPSSASEVLKEISRMETRPLTAGIKKTLSGARTIADIAPVIKEKIQPAVIIVVVFIMLFLFFIILFITSGDKKVTSLDKNGGRDLTSPEHPDMVLIEGGDFQIGTKQYPEDNNFPRKVHLDDFYIDIHEVTNEKYGRYIIESGKPPPSKEFWPTGKYHQGEEKYPVTGISQQDAADYCIFYGKELPTEEQWERAARTTKLFYYPWGNHMDKNLANFATNYLVEVGFFPKDKNAYGIFDLTGNAQEWTKSTQIIKVRNEDSANHFIVRGGSYVYPSEPEKARLTHRTLIRIYDPHIGFKNIGFRCVQRTE
ncbi:MAG: protein kinase [Acidobacteria bacterium]|nr:protein kinase [Acidobacteriota bacterium]